MSDNTVKSGLKHRSVCFSKTVSSQCKIPFYHITTEKDIQREKERQREREAQRGKQKNTERETEETLGLKIQASIVGNLKKVMEVRVV